MENQARRISPQYLAGRPRYLRAGRLCFDLGLWMLARFQFSIAVLAALVHNAVLLLGWRIEMRAAISLLLALAMIAAWDAIPAGADEAAAEDDHFILYRVAGRTWMLKRTPKPGNEGGDQLVTHLRYEVTAAWPDRAETVQTLLDAGRGETEGKGNTIPVAFDRDNLMFRDPVGMRKIRFEKLRVAAGTFDCIRWRGDLDGGSDLWLSTEFPTLIVKSEDRFGIRELIEFTRVPGDPGYQEPTRRRGRQGSDDDAEPDPARLFRKRGRSWLLRTTTARGRHGTRSVSHTEYSVKRLLEDGCELTITPLNESRQRDRNKEEQQHQIKFDEHLPDWFEPRQRARIDRVEKRLTAQGLFECNVYTYRDEHEREHFVWYAKEWPGLIVRATASGKEFEQLTELIEFKE